jgi:hypothetical protein
LARIRIKNVDLWDGDTTNKIFSHISTQVAEDNQKASKESSNLVSYMDLKQVEKNIRMF